MLSAYNTELELCRSGAFTLMVPALCLMKAPTDHVYCTACHAHSYPIARRPLKYIYIINTQRQITEFSRCWLPVI